MMDNQQDGRVPDGTGLSQAEPCGLGPTGFDPSRNVFLQNLLDFNRAWGIQSEPSFAQVAHMLAIFGLEFVPSSRPIYASAPLPPNSSRGPKTPRVTNPDRERVAEEVARIVVANGKEMRTEDLLPALADAGLVINGKSPRAVLTTMLWRCPHILRKTPDGYWPAASDGRAPE